jgi:hypothetical protein
MTGLDGFAGLPDAAASGLRLVGDRGLDHMGRPGSEGRGTVGCAWREAPKRGAPSRGPGLGAAEPRP